MLVTRRNSVGDRNLPRELEMMRQGKKGGKGRKHKSEAATTATARSPQLFLGRCNAKAAYILVGFFPERAGGAATYVSLCISLIHGCRSAHVIPLPPGSLSTTADRVKFLEENFRVCDEEQTDEGGPWPGRLRQTYVETSADTAWCLALRGKQDTAGGVDHLEDVPRALALFAAHRSANQEPRQPHLQSPTEEGTMEEPSDPFSSWKETLAFQGHQRAVRHVAALWGAVPSISLLAPVAAAEARGGGELTLEQSAWVGVLYNVLNGRGEYRGCYSFCEVMRELWPHLGESLRAPHGRLGVGRRLEACLQAVDACHLPQAVHLRQGCVRICEHMAHWHFLAGDQTMA
ncbi:hypothetical protein CYMTET_51223, partial [Cymbomonas tetramitiformis]